LAIVRPIYRKAVLKPEAVIGIVGSTAIAPPEADFTASKLMST
jgi:hypothetical protein